MCKPSQGACFEVHFEKSRGIYGADVEPFEAKLEDGVWTTKSIRKTCTKKHLIGCVKRRGKLKILAGLLSINGSGWE